MANAQGTNQFDRFAKQPGYGAQGHLERLQREAVMAGKQGATSAIETPRRSKRQATEGRTGGARQAPAQAGPAVAPQQPPAQAPQPDIGDPKMSVAAFWAEVSTIPGVSEIAREYADEVLGTAGA